MREESKDARRYKVYSNPDTKTSRYGIVQFGKKTKTTSQLETWLHVLCDTIQKTEIKRKNK